MSTVNFSYENKLVGNAYQNTPNELNVHILMYISIERHGNTQILIFYSYIYTPLKVYIAMYTNMYTPYSHFESTHAHLSKYTYVAT